MSVLEHNIIRWSLLIISILMVSGITYVYTNRNKQFTIIFTLLAMFFIGVIELISIVEAQLHTHFLGKFDSANLPYISSAPGWGLLIHAWHIWAIPVLFVVVVAGIAIYFIIRYEEHLRAASIQTPSQTQPQSTAKPDSTTRAQRLSQFMVMDAAKKETRETNEKLAEALLTNAAYEIKISDLKARVKQLESEMEETKKNLSEEIETLELELSAKNRENEYISNQLSERSHELVRAQEMLEKLASMQRKG